MTDDPNEILNLKIVSLTQVTGVVINISLLETASEIKIYLVPEHREPFSH